jgi:hypothetical protein
MMDIEIAVWSFVSVKIDGLWEIFGATDDVGRDKYAHLKFCWKGFHFSHACTSRQSV